MRVINTVITHLRMIKRVYTWNVHVHTVNSHYLGTTWLPWFNEAGGYVSNEIII